MTMVFCRKCGKSIHHTALSCPACGGVQNAQAEQARLQATAGFSALDPALAKTWVRRFQLIQKAGGPKFPKLRQLNFGEGFTVFFNLGAFLLGPIYFLYLGMWKRAISVLVFSIVLVFVLTVVWTAMGLSADGVALAGVVAFTTRANRDFYRKTVLGDNGWW